MIDFDGITPGEFFEWVRKPPRAHDIRNHGTRIITVKVVKLMAGKRRKNNRVEVELPDGSKRRVSADNLIAIDKGK